MRRRTMPSKIWDRGKKLFQDGQVNIENLDEERQVVEATVYGTYAYDVSVGRDPDNDNCTCPYFAENGFCKHVAAVVELFKFAKDPIETLFDVNRDSYDDDETDWTDPTVDFPEIKMVHKRKSMADLAGERYLQSIDLPEKRYFTPLAETVREPLVLDVTMMVGQLSQGWNYPAENHLFLRLRVARKTDNKFYVVNNLKRFLAAYMDESVYKTAGKNEFQLGETVFSGADKALIDFMTVTGLPSFDGNGTLDMNKYYLLADRVVPKFIELCNELQNFHFQKSDHQFLFDSIEYQPFHANSGLIKGALKPDEEGYELTIQSDFQELIFGSAIVINQNVFYQATTQQAIIISRIVDMYNNIMGDAMNRDPADAGFQMHFDKSKEAELKNFIEFFKLIGNLDVSADFFDSQMTPHFDLSKQDNNLQLKLSYDYGGKLIDSKDIDQVPEKRRNTEKEDQAWDYLNSLGFYLRKDVWVKAFDDADVMFNFFMQELPNMRKNGVVTLSDDLKNSLHDSKDLAPKVNVSEKDGLLSVKFSLQGVDENDVDSVLAQLDSQKPYITQADGSLVLLDDEFRKVSKALLNIRQQGKFKNGQLKVHASQAFAVQAALQGTAKFDDKFKQLAENLAHPENFEIKASHPVHGILRPYQAIGVKWLEMLDSYNFGGILADEMGLGKTIQMIAFLLDHIDKDKPDLIISPASLIYNWQEEFTKFAPEIKTQVIDGNKANRRDLIENEQADVLITSYNSARLDVTEYNDRKINYLVLDEAQFVKNSSTKTNQSIRKLKRKNTFALSGTPIENRVEELWAIFEIVMPGLLPSRKAFKQLTADEVAVRVKPFILRREKSVVLKDIPAKVETNLYNELTHKQKTVYLAQLKQMQVKVQGMTGANFVKNKLAILAGLTRLRQICDTPALYLDDYKGDSGKLEQLTEILRQAEENNRHVLIFSQFTSMLSILENELDKQHLDHYVLQGSTKPKERLKMVNAFNAGEKNIFLISLKAGGTGLNLTGADMVVLVDLWWNPAVEDQATARAHRIGQKKQVDVFRLITKGTIEEQIYKLQEKKRNFVDQVLSGTENKGSLTEEEVRLILGIEEG